ncbi:hypothetical protein A3A49_02240 [Candidatus Curtissbacteria bacterium RIFCSPLOWO2_01_FULL_38_11b]|uniref:histidine kinase n=1 Tax=Candidatus Curtissbacteria bacterium RIFCSPLOWO2_01_FULL_38_11b TaxID=1797725 RepID=A0A1F5GZ35_9BACT|nr:MAG: hypothetical protein A3A49_02240 [Candidatus Curtissbacteria bacterium RIFCSPLOWO2_01_FULL_38_11b]
MSDAPTPYSKKTFEALWEIEKVVLETVDFEEATKKVVNIVLNQLGYLKYGYHVIVLTLLDNEKKMLRRIAISETEAARKFLQASPIPFQKIEIPLATKENLLVKAIDQGKIQITSQVADVLYPALSKEWVENFQQKLGIKTSIVFPVKAREKMLGALIFSLNKDNSEIKEEEWVILDSFVGAVGIALDNALLFRSLKLTTQKLDKANKRLKELDKLKDDFVSLASHELRTPMTAIKSYLWMALNKKKYELSSDLSRYLQRAYISTERLINLVNDMLNISRIESGRLALILSEIDLVDLANDVVEEVLPKALERKISLKIDSKSVSSVLCDKDKIHEVIINLIGNSLKFTKPGGNIVISFDQKPPYVYFSVTDTGVGVTKRDMDRLFKKFSMVEHSYVAASTSGGTGLGLYISKSIINFHKGTISAYSPGTGKGSTFTFSLPIIDTTVAKELQQETPKLTEETKGLEKKSLNFI